MPYIALEYLAFLLIFLLALGVALALISFGALTVVWAISRGYVQIQTAAQSASPSNKILSPSEAAAADHSGVVAISSRRSRHAG